MSSLSWLGKTLCPPDCLVKSDIKALSCAAIFRLGIVVLQCVRTGEVFCGLHVDHVHIICPVRDVTHVRKCTRPSPAFPYCKRRKAGRGPGNEATVSASQQLALITSLPFVHTARRYYRLNGLVRSSDWNRRGRQRPGGCMHTDRRYATGCLDMYHFQPSFL